MSNPIINRSSYIRKILNRVPWPGRQDDRGEFRMTTPPLLPLVRGGWVG